jgi:hypothetical protein
MNTSWIGAAWFLAWGILLPASAFPAASGPSTMRDSSGKNGENEKPFKPNWENEFQLGYSSQQAGQVTSSLAYTGTQHVNEAGDFYSIEGELSRQKVEGAGANTGTLTAEGGLGWGSFTPSFSIGYQYGESALRQINGNLTLGFQIEDPLSVNFTLGANAGSHQGPVSQFYPSLQGEVQIDTAGLNTSLGPLFTPWDWWTVSAIIEFEYDTTYQLQSLKDKTIKVPVNQADQVASLTLGLDFTLFKGFTLDLSPQAGKEYLPAGSVYSPQAGGLVFNSSPISQNFVGGTVSAAYSFE